MKYLVVIILIVLVVGAGIVGSHVPFSDQWPLYEALRTTASIIFAVVGAWFAIIYPERLKLSFRGGAVNESQQDSSIHRLFTPIVHSTCILSLVLLVGIIAPLLKQCPFVISHLLWFRGISYAILVALTLWQLVTVIYSLIGPDMLKSHADREERDRKTLEGYTKLQRKNSDSKL